MAIFVALSYYAPAGDLPNGGRIEGINRTVAGLRAAGYGQPPYFYEHATETDRIKELDETDADVWDNDCLVGWYLTADGVQETAPLTHAQTVTRDIARFRAAVEREAEDVERMIAEEAFSPHTDSGHLWSDDVLHAIAKPHVRLLYRLLASAKATPNAANIELYAEQLTLFEATARSPGLLGIYRGAQKAVWRPRRTGERAYGYDVATGGTRTDQNGADVSFPVTYPTGETVATWDALADVRAL